jgi:hypothetical protein
MRDAAADALLAEPVIDRGVNVVDPGIEHGAENRLGLSLADIAGTRGATQFHRAVAQRRDLQTGPAELPLG